MTFSTYIFFLILPIIYFLYWFILYKSLHWQNILILVTSYFLYGWWNGKFLLLLVLSTSLDYMYGFFVASTNKKKAKIFLWLCIFNNLSILGIFKYYNFFAYQIQQSFELLGIQTNTVFLNVVLPVGISFYTFHGMSYVFDIYRGKQKPVSNYVNYSVFVSFFPLLVAGPIERASHLLPQIQEKRNFKYTQSIEGCRLILWGFFKKVVIADSLAGIVNEIFNNYHNHNAITLILGAIAFSFQIYGDFSGYSDIALGTAKLFGFELLSNFKFPYFSRDLGEFWRRWHISLSSWFRDYLYIPLGGSKGGKLKSIRNTFIIFLVSGFWHGASWNFIVWGGIHSIGFLPLLFSRRNRTNISDVVAQNKKLPNLKELFQMIITFTFVTFTWIFFRAQNFDEAIGYLKGIFNNFQHINEIYKYINIFYFIIPLIIGDWWFRRNERVLKVPQNLFLKFSILLTIVLSILYFYFENDTSKFIYFQF